MDETKIEQVDAQAEEITPAEVEVETENVEAEAPVEEVVAE